MIFPKKQARQVFAGRKTVCRVPRHGRQCAIKAGRFYAVQPGAGKAALCHIHILGVELARLCDFGYEDAKAEGFSTQREYFDAWLEQHGQVDIDAEVWVIRFEVEHERPRFLAPAARPHGSTHGYTTSASASLEPVQVVSEDFQRQVTKEAHERYAETHANRKAHNEARSLSNKLREARVRALNQGVDISPEIVSIEAELAQIQAKLRHAA